MPSRKNIQIGDKAHYFTNIDDIMSLQVIEVMDIYEVSWCEQYAKLAIYPFEIVTKKKGIKGNGEGTPLYGIF